MTDFGFKLSKSSTIVLNTDVSETYHKLIELEPTVKTCINCGSCGATCMAAEYSGMSFRKVILSLQRGLDAKHMLTNCMLCGKCTMVCPRGVNTRNAILTICRNYD